MSQEARELLTQYAYIVDADAKNDFMDESVTNTSLIACVSLYVLPKSLKGLSIPLGFTAIKTDHHDDHTLGELCHFNGYAADCWPLIAYAHYTWSDVDSEQMRDFMASLASGTNPYLRQVGLGGSVAKYLTTLDWKIQVFPDGDEDHIHLGSTGP